MDATVIQVGHSRDGGRYFHTGARAGGADVALVETESGRSATAWGDRIGEPCFAGARWTEPVTAAVVEAGLDIAATADVVAVVPGFELFTVAAQRLAARLGLPHGVPDEVIERLRRKDRQRSFLAQHLAEGDQPAFAICSSEEEVETAARVIGLPVVIKPVDSGGSSSVRLAPDVTAARQAARPVLAGQVLDDGTASARLVLVEEYVDGAEHGVQGVVDVHGDVRVLSVTTKALRTDDGGFLERRHLLAPPDRHADVVDFVTRVVGALGLRGSAFHADIRRRDGAPVLVEAGARLSGAYIPRALTLAGVDWGAAALAVTAGGRAGDAGPLDAHVGIELLTPEVLPGVVRVGPTDRTELVLDLTRLRQGGAYTDFHDRIGARIVLADDEDELERALGSWHGRP